MDLGPYIDYSLSAYISLCCFDCFHTGGAVSGHICYQKSTCHPVSKVPECGMIIAPACITVTKWVQNCCAASPSFFRNGLGPVACVSITESPLEPFHLLSNIHFCLIRMKFIFAAVLKLSLERSDGDKITYFNLKLLPKLIIRDLLLRPCYRTNVGVFLMWTFEKFRVFMGLNTSLFVFLSPQTLNTSGSRLFSTTLILPNEILYWWKLWSCEWFTNLLFSIRDSPSYERPYNLDIMFHIVTFYVLTHHQMFIYSAFEWVMYFSLASNKYQLCIK